MYFKQFEWDPANKDHIAQHNVTYEEVKESCYNKLLVFRSRMGRYYVLGRTDAEKKQNSGKTIH